MTLRLTLLFSGATLLILLLVSLLLHWRLASTLQAEDETILLENMDALLAAWRQSPHPVPALVQQMALEAESSRQEPYYVRYLTGERIAFETPGMSTILPPAVFPARPASADRHPAPWRAPDGRIYLLHTAAGGDAESRFQAALDVTHDDLLLRGYRRDLLAAVLSGTLLAALAGLLTARRGLRPLERMAESIQRITAGRLDQRIGGREWPRELAELAMGFDAMLERLEDSFVRLTRFSADLAHELRTPLTILRGEAEVALSQARSEREYRAVLESSLEEFGRLTTLVDRLLFLARADAGAAALDPRPLDAGSEVAAVCEFYAPLADEKGVRLAWSGAGPVSADPILLRRAVANLLANALEHTPRGGDVRVEVGPEEGGTAVRVRDTGSGIAAEHLPRVFDRFYQVDPARERKGAGAGLGLALVRSIMQLHGGSVRLESRPGSGTTAVLLFPAPRPAPRRGEV